MHLLLVALPVMGGEVPELLACVHCADDTWYWEHLDTSWAWNSHQDPQLQWLGEIDRYSFLPPPFPCKCIGATTTPL